MDEPASSQALPDWAPPFVALSRDAPIYIAAPAAELIGILRRPARSDRYSLFLICGLVESIVRFLAVAGIAELTFRNEGCLPSNLAPSLRNVIETPQFGTWRQILDQVVRVSRRSLGLLPELEAARDELVTLFRGDREDDQANLIGVRNAIAHDSLAQEARCEVLVAEWGPSVGAVLARLAFLREIEVWTLTASGPRRLNGPDPAGVEARSPAALGGLTAGSVSLLRGGTFVPVEPFGRYGPPRQAAGEVPQIFIRRDRDRRALVFSLAGSRDALQAYETAALLDRFTALFSIKSAAAKMEFRRPDFDVEVNAASRAFEGRADDLATMLEAIRATRSGLLWLQGVAGSGKSYLMARAASDLATAAEGLEGPAASENGPAEQVLIYRFRSGTASAEQFLSWLVERLDRERGQAALNEAEQSADLASNSARLLALAAELIGADRGRRVVIFMDGLDELERRQLGTSTRILEAVIPAAKEAVFVVSGQPTGGLPDLIARLGGQTLFGGNLRRMTAPELRAILDRRVPDAVKRMVAQDSEGDGERNLFLRRLLEVSFGSPHYLNGFIHQIDQGIFRDFDAREAGLLRSADDVVDAAFEPLGDREGGYYGLWIGCLLAVQREALSREALAALIGRLTGEAERSTDLTRRALANIGGYVSYAPDGEGLLLADGAVEQRILSRADSAPILAKIRKFLVEASLASGNDAATPYLLRNGISELVGAGRAAEAAALLSDAGYLSRRLAIVADRGGDAGIRADWSAVLRAKPALTEDQRAWQVFWATDGARLAIDDDPDRCRNFLECGLTYAPGTVVGGAVRGLRDPPSPPLLVPETGYRRQDRITAVLRAHDARIKGVVELSNGVLLSWDRDERMNFWDRDGASVTATRRFVGWWGGAFELSTKCVCAYSSGWIEFLALDGERIGEPVAVPGLSGAIEPTGSGMIVAWTSNDETAGLQVLSLDGRLLRSLPQPPSLPQRSSQRIAGVAALADGRLIVWNGNCAVVTGMDGHATEALPDFPPGEIDRVVPLSSGGAVVVSGSDGRYEATLWKPGRPLASLYAGWWFYGAYEAPDHRILAFGSDGWRLFAADGSPVGPTKPTALQWLRMVKDGTIVGFVRRRHLNSVEEHLVIANADLTEVRNSYEWKWPDRPEDAIALNDGRILFWTGPTMQIWDRSRKAAGLGRRLAGDAAVRGAARWTRFLGGAQTVVDSARQIVRGEVPRAASAAGEAAAAEVGRAGGILRSVFAPGKAAREDLARDGGGSAAGRLAGRAIAGALALGGGQASPSQMLIGRRSDAAYLGRTFDLDSGRFVTLRTPDRTGQQLWSAYGEPLSTFGSDDIVGLQPLSGERVLAWTRRGAFIRFRMDPDSPVPLLVSQGLPIEGHAGFVSGVTKLADGRFLSGGGDGRLRFWTGDGDPEGEAWAAHDGGITGVGILGDGRLVSWSSRGDLKLWSANGAFLRRHLMWGAAPEVAAGRLTLAAEGVDVRCSVA